MILSTSLPHTPFTEQVKRYLGRSKKVLKPIIKHDGRVFVAFYEGRPGRVFGPNAQVALKNLRTGAYDFNRNKS